MLSVIIINYNTFELTCQCISSVYKYTSAIPFEIVLVDNASTERNPEDFAAIFPMLRLIKSAVNLGFSKGNNLGISHANGDVILLLNSDTRLIEDSLSICYNYLLSLNKEAVVTCKLIYPEGHVQHQCNRFPSIKNQLTEMLRIHKLFGAAKRGFYLMGFYFDHDEIIKPDWFWGTFFMFNKSLLSRLPYKHLDQQFFMYCEDLKWCYDFSRLHVPRIYLPTTEIIHYLGKSSGTDYRTSHIVKNELTFIKSSYGRAYQLLFTIFKALNLISAFNTQGIRSAKVYVKNIFV